MQSHFPLPSAGNPTATTTFAPPPTHRADISSARTVDKEPAGFPLGKITSCYTLGISRMAPSPSILKNIYPMLSSNWPHIAVQILFLATPSFIKGCGSSHSKCSSPYSSSKDRKKAQPSKFHHLRFRTDSSRGQIKVLKLPHQNHL